MTDKDPQQYSRVQYGSLAGAIRLYEVVTGDSLPKIAKREYGSPRLWRRIFEANRNMIQEPRRIYPGQKLKIPPA